MDWLLPGVPPTDKPVEVATVSVIHFRDGEMASERVYFDQASILVQLGLLDPKTLPVAGVQAARKVLNDELPSNDLMKRTVETMICSRPKLPRFQLRYSFFRIIWGPELRLTFCSIFRQTLRTAYCRSSEAANLRSKNSAVAR